MFSNVIKKKGDSIMDKTRIIELLERYMFEVKFYEKNPNGNNPYEYAFLSSIGQIAINDTLTGISQDSVEDIKRIKILYESSIKNKTNATKIIKLIKQIIKNENK